MSDMSAAKQELVQLMPSLRYERLSEEGIYFATCEYKDLTTPEAIAFILTYPYASGYSSFNGGNSLSIGLDSTSTLIRALREAGHIAEVPFSVSQS